MSLYFRRHDTATYCLCPLKRSRALFLTSFFEKSAILPEAHDCSILHLRKPTLGKMRGFPRVENERRAQRRSVAACAEPNDRPARGPSNGRQNETCFVACKRFSKSSMLLQRGIHTFIWHTWHTYIHTYIYPWLTRALKNARGKVNVLSCCRDFPIADHRIEERPVDVQEVSWHRWTMSC